MLLILLLCCCFLYSFCESAKWPQAKRLNWAPKRALHWALIAVKTRLLHIELSGGCYLKLFEGRNMTVEYEFSWILNYFPIIYIDLAIYTYILIFIAVAFTPPTSGCIYDLLTISQLLYIRTKHKTFQFPDNWSKRLIVKFYCLCWFIIAGDIHTSPAADAGAGGGGGKKCNHKTSTGFRN